MSFDVVEQFEQKIAEFYGAPYAVAVDCCTHAVELCLRYKNVQKTSVPKHTYLSIPMTLEKLGLTWKFNDEEWIDYYKLEDTNIIDAAVLWKPSSYIPKTLMCLSFQYKKHLSLGRGGAILCNNKNGYIILKKMSYDGRLPDIPWKHQNVNILGYHYYMTPETAQLGLDKLLDTIKKEPIIWNWKNYPDLSKMDVFNDLQFEKI